MTDLYYYEVIKERNYDDNESNTMYSSEKIQFLFFSSLSDGALDALADKVQPVELPVETQIIKEGALWGNGPSYEPATELHGYSKD